MLFVAGINANAPRKGSRAIDTPESVPLCGVVDRCRGVKVHPEWIAAQFPHLVLESDNRARKPALAGERERAHRYAMTERHVQQRINIRVAADHPVHDHDFGRSDVTPKKYRIAFQKGHVVCISPLNGFTAGRGKRSG